VEKQIKPEIEIHDHYKKDLKKGKHLICNPITIARNEKEKCYIEPSINSVRVRLKLYHLFARSASALKRMMTWMLLLQPDSVNFSRSELKSLKF
jgi:actin related protein 2/3 complex subunit 4